MLLLQHGHSCCLFAGAPPCLSRLGKDSRLMHKDDDDSRVLGEGLLLLWLTKQNILYTLTGNLSTYCPWVHNPLQQGNRTSCWAGKKAASSSAFQQSMACAAPRPEPCSRQHGARRSSHGASCRWLAWTPHSSLDGLLSAHAGSSHL